MDEKKGMPGWIKGCLTGCAVLLVLVVILMTVVCQQVKGMFRGVTQAETSREQLVKELGDYDEYNPGAQVSVAVDQLERFLRVRESMVDDRARLDQVFRDFNLDEALEEESKWRKAFGVISAVSGLLNPAGEYIAARNAKLLEEEMSIGEYAWIYGITYYSWLENDLTAGPELTFKGETRELFQDGDSPLSPREQHRRYRRTMDALFRNQIGGLPEGASTRREELEREYGRFENTPRTVLWEGGLPDADAMVLEPYRNRLEATWHRSTNLMEMPFEEDRGGIRIGPG